MKNLILISILAALSASSHAVDFDKLKNLRDLVKKPAEQSKPAPQQAGAPEASEAQLPSIPPIGNVPEADEVLIGRHIAGNLLGAAPLVKDPAVQAYVNGVGRWVASSSERPDLNWTFGVIESTDLNAFAAPGGYVFITRGLYQLFRDESELAGVLGHEIAHVVKKHHLKVLQKSQAIGAGSDLLKKRFGDKKIASSLIGNGAEIMARGLDKDAEFEADRMGVVLAARAGYDPFGLPAVLQEISDAAVNSGQVALLFKTHPHPDDRLARLGESMGAHFDGMKDAKNLGDRLVRIP